MKFKFLQAASASLMMSVCGFSNATLITHNGYTLDTDTKIVSNGVVEWLQWSETKGDSIDSALALNGGDGWTLANVQHMNGLFGNFGWAPSIDENIDATTYGVYTPATTTDNFDHFIELFGYTYTCVGGQCSDEPDYVTRAIIGYDLDGDLKYGGAVVVNGGVNSTYSSIRDPRATIFSDNEFFWHRSDTYSRSGIALIREIPQLTSSVPEPSTLAIFALGMIGLASRRFKKQA